MRDAGAAADAGGERGIDLMQATVRHVDAAVVFPVDYTRLLWATVIGYLAFGEIPDA